MKNSIFCIIEFIRKRATISCRSNWMNIDIHISLFTYRLTNHVTCITTQNLIIHNSYFLVYQIHEITTWKTYAGTEIPAIPRGPHAWHLAIGWYFKRINVQFSVSTAGVWPKRTLICLCQINLYLFINADDTSCQL